MDDKIQELRDLSSLLGKIPPSEQFLRNYVAVLQNSLTIIADELEAARRTR